MSAGQKLYAWVDERVHLDDLVKFMGKKYVPVHRGSVWYYFGGVSLFLFIIQVLTGIMLLLYYKSGEELAFESIQFIMSKVQFGWLIRSVHSWSAHIMVISVFIHLFTFRLAVLQHHAPQDFRRKVWNAGEAKIFSLGQRIADTQHAVVRDADDIANLTKHAALTKNSNTADHPNASISE